MLIIAVVVVKGMIRTDASGWILLVEIVMCPIIFRKVPIPSENKPISEKERVHFNKRVKQIYVFETDYGSIYECGEGNRYCMRGE